MAKGMSLIEVMIAVLILAAAFIPVGSHLGRSTTDTQLDTAEADAMQFACDQMDEILMSRPFDDVKDSTAAEEATIIPLGKKTEVKIKIEVWEVPLGGTSMPNFKIPVIPYHFPCKENDPVQRGIEQNDLSGQIHTDTVLTFDQLDEERLRGLSGAEKCELKDIKITVKWRPKGYPDSAFETHPIILYSRKARL